MHEEAFGEVIALGHVAHTTLAVLTHPDFSEVLTGTIDRCVDLVEAIGFEFP